MPRSHDLFVKARNVPVAASVVWRHLARGRGHAATIGARAVPRLAPLADRLAAGQSPYVVSASAALAAGDLGEARERAAKAGWRGRRLRGFIEGEIALLSPSGRARTAPCSVTELGDGPVLHLVTNSLPHIVAGYTTRTQGLLAGQRQTGLRSEEHTSELQSLMRNS